MTLPIHQLIPKLESVTTAVKESFSDLSPNQLNWKPTPSSWSIAQCLDHIMVSNELYRPILTQVLAGTYPVSIWAKISPFSRMNGRMMVNNLGPEVKRKMTSPASFRPSQSTIEPDIVARFLSHQHALLDLYRAFETKGVPDHNVASPASALLTFPVGDALTIIAVHEERHLQQAQNVLEKGRELGTTFA